MRQYFSALLQQTQKFFKLIGLAVALAWSASPLLVTCMLILILISGLVPPFSLFLYQQVINRTLIDLHITVTTNSFAQKAPLILWIGCAAGSIVVQQLLQLMAYSLQQMAGDHVMVTINEKIIQAVNSWQGLIYFEDPAFKDDLSRAQSSISQIGLQIIVQLVDLIARLLTLISTIMILARLQLLIPILIIFTSIPSIIFLHRYFMSIGSHLYWMTPETRRLEYYRNVVLTPEVAKDIRLYELGSHFIDLYSSLFRKNISTLDAFQKRALVKVFIARLPPGITSGCVFIYIIWQALQGSFSTGSLVFYCGTILLLQNTLSNIDLSVIQDLEFLPGLFRILQAPPDLPVSKNPLPAPRPVTKGIVFEHVSFAYPGQKEAVLSDVSFSLAPGECVGLVGQNGAGKTTIVKLLLRLYDPTAGRILLDDIDLREYDINDLRQEFGAIFQDFIHYNLTIAENIAVGRLEVDKDKQRVEEAAAKANVLTLLQELPDGLDTQLGKSFGGLELSGGQWQRLALARAFFRQSRLLVLDEPTASLDVQTEYDLYTHFQSLTQQQMTLLISHRFSTIRMAKRMLYLANGRIQEAGTHNELLNLNGEYARLYHLQASQYIEETASQAGKIEESE